MAAAVALAPVVDCLYMDPSPKREFFHVGGVDSDRMGVVADIFHRILTPLYGPQDKAIRQIGESSDRSCFLLYEDDHPKGVLVFKTVLSSEYAGFGVNNSIEVKSLFVDNSTQNSGKGLGSALVDKLQVEVERLGINHENIHVTVSETKEESLAFFKKKGFSIAHSWKDRYQPGVTEYLLSCPRKIRETASAILAQEAHDHTPELMHVIHDAHWGDIHALQKLADGTFVSASKDNCLYKWDEGGNCVKIVSEVEPGLQTERSWITALRVVNAAYFISGNRDGRVFLWKTGGDFVREISLKKPISRDHVSLPYNFQRVNCLAVGMDPCRPSIFVGFPTTFVEYNLIEGKTVSVAKAHGNDWVYCIHVLASEKLLTVTGGCVDLWKKEAFQWQQEKKLLAEDKAIIMKIGGKQVRQRVFISSLCLLSSRDNQFGLSLFDGSVRILDVCTHKVINIWKEHTGRVWTLEDLGNGLFASGGEDRKIKIWDLRTNVSAHAIENHAGGVTALLKFRDHQLLAGTCPEDPIKRGAEIRFYDIRHMAQDFKTNFSG